MDVVGCAVKHIGDITPEDEPSRKFAERSTAAIGLVKLRNNETFNDRGRRRERSIEILRNAVAKLVPQSYSGILNERHLAIEEVRNRREFIQREGADYGTSDGPVKKVCGL